MYGVINIVELFDLNCGGEELIINLLIGVGIC